MPDHSSQSADAMVRLREDFRRCLETFYAQLKLAPPYDSVEKAVGALNETLKTMPPEVRRRLLDDPALQWAQYGKAFAAGGLHLKHRGIIASLIRDGRGAGLPAEYRTFLDLFLPS
jgi:hypothetical protein